MRQEDGFGVIEGLLIFVILGLVAGAGWFVWQSKNSANKSLDSAAAQTQAAAGKKQAPTIKPAKAQPITDSNTYKLITYKSDKLGFTVLIPERIYFDYGACKMVDGSYRPDSQWVPSKVFESGGKVFISVAYYYALTGVTESVGITNFSGCQKTDNSLDTIVKYQAQQTPVGVSVEVLPFYIGTASSQQDVTNFVQSNIDENLKVTKLTPVSGQEWQTAELGLVDQNMASGYGKVTVHYYPARHKVVLWSLGQYNHYSDPAGGDTQTDYASQMVDSFKFN